MKKKEFDFIKLFESFILDSQKGRRLKADGSKIKTGTVSFYRTVKNSIECFCKKEKMFLRVRDTSKMNKRELSTESNYWKKFYRNYSGYLYSRGCYDNYVGAHFKVIRTFFNYLEDAKHIQHIQLNRIFHSRAESIPIIVLSREQLQFLIENKEFENSLPDYLKRTKDILVFGCTVGLRYSDLMALTKRNISATGGSYFLIVRSVKTSTDTSIRLPDYAVTIINKYKGIKTLLPNLTKNRLNVNLKKLCLQAGWAHEIEKSRHRQGLKKSIQKSGGQLRFCDMVTTHTMRRTAITTLLTLGVPEMVVRKISGHAPGSKEFYKYVHYSQAQVDNETEKAFAKLLQKPNKITS